MKNYLVIGGSSGIGKALVNLLAEDHHKVFATYYLNETKSEQSNVHFQYLDVTAPEINLKDLPDTIDGFVYCPGSIQLKPFARIKPEAFAEDLQLQVIGAIKTIQTVLPKLKLAEQPAIVLFSTVAVQNGFNFHSQVAVSKGAIEGLTKSLAAEFAPKIRVNAIAPSLTDTPLAAKLLSSEDKKQANAALHPLKKIGTANDIAQMAKFLLSENAQWITGQIFAVDGGMSTLKL
jgi:NAD(P)-dependent dehydrogenase (short-subunit alcohol dehydrogenase family)